MLQTLLDNLKIEPIVLLQNGVLFVLLLLFLNTFFWKPILRHLDSRKDSISNAYKAVEDTRHELDALRADYQARLAAIEAEARGQIQKTVHEAQDQREKMIEEARAQAEDFTQQGAIRIEQERDQTIAGMRDTLNGAALNALAKASRGTTSPAQSKLVDEYIAENVVRS